MPFDARSQPFWRHGSVVVSEGGRRTYHLAARWGPRTHSAPLGRCVQTTRASQMTKHAARAHLTTALLRTTQAPARTPPAPLFASPAACDGFGCAGGSSAFV